MPNIQFFENDEYDDRGKHVISFWTKVDEQKINCTISYDALRARFGLTDQYNPIPCFTAHRRRIEVLAESLILRSRYESNGTILIKREDL